MKKIFLVILIIIAVHLTAKAQGEFVIIDCYVGLEDRIAAAHGRIHWTDSTIIIDDKDDDGLIQIVLDESTFEKDSTEDGSIFFMWIGELTHLDKGKSSKMSIVLSFDDIHTFFTVQSLTSDFYLTYRTSEFSGNKDDFSRDKTYVIKEAYLIDESGETDLMETKLDYLPSIIQCRLVNEIL